MERKRRRNGRENDGAKCRETERNGAEKKPEWDGKRSGVEGKGDKKREGCGGGGREALKRAVVGGSQYNFPLIRLLLGPGPGPSFRARAQQFKSIYLNFFLVKHIQLHKGKITGYSKRLSHVANDYKMLE